ncbi:Cytochrome c oxidase subunit 6B [Ceratobasidium sp. 414]|nr:Cytochrome c oxidase subunit 6B [Ceratobasidium sp. 414]
MSEAEDLKTKYVLQTAGFDGAELIRWCYQARFPNTNQTKHCYQNYIDYYKCINAKGEEFAPCKQFYRAYHSLCPNEWVSRFNEQREAGTFPTSLEP